MRNRRFLAFSCAMIGSYVLTFQVYLALPLETRRLAPSDTVGTIAVAVLFAISGVIAIAGQVRVTAWCKRRWSHGQCITMGLVLMGLAFLPPVITASTVEHSPWVFLPLFVSVALLTLGSVVVFPFEMDTIVTLAEDRLVATHYGLYNTICGVGIAIGNLATGAALDLARTLGAPWAPWLVLALIGLASAACVRSLSRSGRLTARPVAVS
jgi:MFS family permease